MAEPAQSAWTISAAKRIGAVLGDIKIAHSVFALPFALMSAHLAFLSKGGYRADTLVAILICMVSARTAAMSFNRYLDRKLDAENPRTSERSIPSGRARPSDSLIVVTVCVLIFVLGCWFLGPLPLALSLPTIAFLLSYSASKRFTILTHLWLGAALGIAPAGAWIAITGGLSLMPILLTIAVTFWVAGFDVIYALQDVRFDRERKLHSIPALWGERNALLAARLMHLLTLTCLLYFGFLTGLGWIYWATLAVVAVLMVVEHALVRPDDLSRVGIAFFTMNGAISIVLYLSVLASTLIDGAGWPGQGV